MKSIVVTPSTAAMRSMIPCVHDGTTSSLKPTVGCIARRMATLSSVGWIAEPERVDEPHRPRRASENLRQARARLPQREVERRGLERPPPPVALQLILGRLRPHLDRVEVSEELRERHPRAGQREVARPQALLGIGHADLFADAFLAPAAKPQLRR